MGELVDLFAYHDLTERIGAYSTGGGAHLRGNSSDLRVADGEAVLADGETERARVAGVLKLHGSRRVRGESSTDPPTVGLTIDGAAVMTVTTERLIFMLVKGASPLGNVAEGREVHTFVLPWDLVGSISMPKKVSISDRIAGGRVIELMCEPGILVQFMPGKRAEIDGEDRKITDDGVFRGLIRYATEHRIAHSPPSEHARLNALLTDDLPVDDGDLIAWLIDPEETGLPAHLVGRVVERTDGDDPAD